MDTPVEDVKQKELSSRLVEMKRESGGKEMSWKNLKTLIHF